ncbi:putative GTPase (G3E family)-like protein [Planococcus antarcticus DSM 14505]|uniref:Cobalamin biosynthesis protein n=1 Tax=Planococcus antarcticus DSM 14505 TaxID=1185653 RepID=A0A1C7DHU5_9BACL|nr:GTP-binding protein [Planococcus antarcticus]ANU11076.1 cobalamin biosynthesis protein [Planococcus antarcticus DSM 14505]EIM05924.1 putative GTPase (G3E family)-like protein [Planococcus antarcticus DSM 14505]
MKKVEIIILSGFLGSGKTTFLQKILAKEQQAERKVAVIMNEVGKVSIDSDSVPKETPLKELLNGCVCCTLSGEFEIQIAELLREYDLDVIYIETTGVAHPIEVLDTCLSPLLAEKLKIRSIITLVDAVSWINRKKLRIPLQRLIIEQVKHADIILLNKVDCVSKHTQNCIEEEVRSINPSGKIVPTVFAEVNVNELITSEKLENGEHEKVHVTQHLHIKTYVHTFLHPINQKLFEEFLKAMPDTIYRIKGYIRFTESEETLLFQYSYGMPFHTKAGLKMKNTLVFIGDDIDHDILQKILNDIEKKSILPI